MGCGCSDSKTTVWIFTDPNGVSQPYSKEIEAKVAKIKAGGGTITSRPK